ncbi:MAG: DNA-binding protein [Clostridia bacterium]|nr:DNA-binding protein [Clostridia bacterium]
MDTTISNRPQMLTIRETARTGILPEAALRTLVKQNRIPGVYVGCKFLVNYDRLCDWLNNPENHTTARG